jgi:hypothetical protein
MWKKISRTPLVIGAILTIPFLLVTIQYFISEGKLSPSTNKSIRIASIDYLGQPLDSHVILSLKDWVNSVFCLGLLFLLAAFFPIIKEMWTKGGRWRRGVIIPAYLALAFVISFNFLIYFSPKLEFNFSKFIRSELRKLDPSYTSPDELSACYQKYSYDTIRPELDKYRYCDAPSDCIVIRGTICGFQSGTLVNGKYVDQAQRLINSCPSGACIEDTFGIQVVPDCVNNQCQFKVVGRP